MPPNTWSPATSDRGAHRLRIVSLLHGLFYVVTGFWPIVSIKTFQLVTGPKRDLWLVKTAGALITVIGAVLTLAGLRRRVTPEILMLGMGSALGLTAIDVVYYRRGVLGPVYLLDAVTELGLASGWLLAWRAGMRAQEHPEQLQ